MTKAPASSAFFDAIARRYDRVYARGRDESRESLSHVLRALAPRSRVLDLGVGTGRELPALLDAGHSVVGMDASSEMLGICGERARRIPLVLGDFWSPLPWDDSSFDAVIALHGTLSHAPNEAARAAFPREVARVLKPGGVFVAEVPTDAWLHGVASEGGDGVVRTGEGRGRFVDEVTKASIDVWLASAEGWRALFAGALGVRVEEGLPGEVRILGTRGAK